MIKLKDLLIEVETKNKKQQLDEGLMDSFITLIATVGAAFAVKVAGPMLVQYVSDTIGNIKSAVQGIVKPTVMQKFEKALDNDRQFSKEALQLITDRGGLDRIKNWSAFAKAVIQLPAFVNLFEKFCEENNIEKKSQTLLLVRIEYRLKETMQRYGADVVKFIKSKHPELKDKINEKKKVDVTKLKKGDEIVIDMGQGKETVKVISNFKAGISKFDFVSLKRKGGGAPYTITLSRLEKAIV